MDVSNIQRVNVMIKELTKHGRVDSFDQAISQAQSMYDREITPKVSQVSPQQGFVNGAIQSPTPMIAAVDERQLNSLLHDKLGKVLSAYNDGVMGEIEALRNQISDLKRQMMTATPQSVQRQIEASAPARQEAKPEYNEKQGNFTSSDVSIEKMFYYGNK